MNRDNRTCRRNGSRGSYRTVSGMVVLAGFVILGLAGSALVAGFPHPGGMAQSRWPGLPKMGVTVDVNEMTWIHPTMDAIQDEVRSTRVAIVQLLLRMLQQVGSASSSATNQWSLTNSILNTTSTEALLQLAETNRVIADAVQSKLTRIMLGAGVATLLLFLYLVAIFVTLTGFGCWYMFLQQQQLVIMRENMKLQRKDRTGVPQDDADGDMEPSYQVTGSVNSRGYQRIPVDNASAAA